MVPVDGCLQLKCQRGVSGDLIHTLDMPIRFDPNMRYKFELQAGLLTLDTEGNKEKLTVFLKGKLCTNETHSTLNTIGPLIFNRITPTLYCLEDNYTFCGRLLDKFTHIEFSPDRDDIDTAALSLLYHLI